MILPAGLAALPDFALGLFCLTAWVAPGLIGVHWIRDGVLLMLMEFIVIHSSAFMGTAGWGGFGGRVPRGLAIVGLGLFYSLFVGGFAFAFRTWGPRLGFWGLTLNRLLGALLTPADSGEPGLVMRGWAACTLFYLMAVFATTLLPVPRLGITPAVTSAADIPGSGLWVERPYTVLAAGFVYFTACALSELTGHGWLGKSGENQVGSEPAAGTEGRRS